VERRVELPRPLRVYVQYFTAWVDAEGVPQFRDDVYGRDAATRSAAEDVGPSIPTVGFARIDFEAPTRVQEVASCPD
jgi:hypothetical protein